MIDSHYDLLTILYCCYLKQDFSYIEKIKKDLKDIKGLIANLYFMSKEEMKEELKIEEIDVYEMFKISVNLFQEYFPDLEVIFSIEGCDYIKDSKELEDLHKLGLRNILPVWNNENRYGSGNRTQKGLTSLGKELIEKAVELGISIDMSHMNEATFWDTIGVLKRLRSENKKVTVIASHSNSYSLCPNPRNLKDEQLKALHEVDGMIGLVGYGPFIEKNEKNLKQTFLMHLQHIEKIMGIDQIMIATDNMDFATDLFGIEEDTSLFHHNNIDKELTNLLENYYNKEEQEKILYKNAKDYFREMLVC